MILVLWITLFPSLIFIFAYASMYIYKYRFYFAVIASRQCLDKIIFFCFYFQQRAYPFNHNIYFLCITYAGGVPQFKILLYGNQFSKGFNSYYRCINFFRLGLPNVAYDFSEITFVIMTQVNVLMCFLIV